MTADSFISSNTQEYQHLCDDHLIVLILESTEDKEADKYIININMMMIMMTKYCHY